MDIRNASRFFWDGRETQLHDVVLQPFTNPVEMGRANIQDVADQINRLPDYRPEIQEAFGSDHLTSSQMSAALIAYLHALPKPHAATQKEAGDAFGPNQAEGEGLALFSGKAGCSDCHHPGSLTDNQLHHTGIGFEIAAGRITELVTKIRQVKEQGEPLGQVILRNQDIAELGRFAATLKPSDLGAFRTPSLSNVSKSEPYMHNGSVATLSDALDIEMYYRSLERGRPINLTVEERRELLAYLQTL